MTVSDMHKLYNSEGAEKVMISNQILQNTIDGLKGITRIDLCIIDTEGKVLASTFPEADSYTGSVLAFIDSPADSQVIQGFQFFKIFDENQLEYILLAGGGSEDAYMIGKLVVFQIQNLLVPIKNALIRTTLSRIFFWTIFFWWISITGRRSFISRQKCGARYLS